MPFNPYRNRAYDPPDDWAFPGDLMVTDDGKSVTFRTHERAEKARTALRLRAEGESCPRLIGCPCGGGALQFKWGAAPYCEHCGCLL